MSNRGSRGKGEQRLLYWYRTPPGVRVGRSAIDEDAIRLLEQHNPGIQFDWSRILREPPPAAAVAPRKEERRGRRGGPREARPSPARTAEHAERRATEHSNVAERAERGADTEHPEPEAIERLEAEFLEPEPLEPERREPEPLEPEPRQLIEPRVPASPAEARLGAEGLARLRGRYAEVMARIAERPLDEEAREELKLRAERLNPDTWVTADEVAQGLEVYETVYEGLRALVGTRHRRRRRGHGRRTEPDQ